MTEQQPYDVIRRLPGFELRRYPEHLVAEVEVDGSFASAGNRAFGMLLGFISGNNSMRGKVAMTAPVVQEPAGRPIAMTAPVLQESDDASARHRVAFVMPAEFTLETLPTPSDPRVTIRVIPTQLAAVAAFSGRWSERTYAQQLDALQRAIADAGLTVVGPPRYARFDPPWTPWFLRRNEVVIPVTETPPTAPAQPA